MTTCDCGAAIARTPRHSTWCSTRKLHDDIAAREAEMRAGTAEPGVPVVAATGVTFVKYGGADVDRTLGRKAVESRLP